MTDNSPINIKPANIKRHNSPAGPVFFSHGALNAQASAIKHGFFTRQGGVSKGLYDSLNCGFGSADTQSNIAANRARVCAALNLPADRLAGLYQTHSAECLVIDSFPGKYFENADTRPPVDGLVTCLDNIGLAILGADCLPVLFADPSAGIIGACHAGWRGATGGIIENTVDAMCSIGARLSDITMVIGPGIHQKSYQVSADMVTDILNSKPDAAACFMPDPSAEVSAEGASHYLFDLPLFAQIAGRRAGLNDIHCLPFDTYADAKLFYSHRRATHQNEPDSGRLISVITKQANT
ncbi:MAG: peptidoglycan editing factor PgeF [Alphaproteobacteria bacterium]|nr:peptidoglycan editing factor PgeF [Alphaproteobacteria bacterium]MBL6776843.1 peptidoglycan editing factor PgeF [Alphaproteobacteria bacterium]